MQELREEEEDIQREHSHSFFSLIFFLKRVSIVFGKEHSYFTSIIRVQELREEEEDTQREHSRLFFIF